MSESVIDERAIWGPIASDIDESQERLPNVLEIDSLTQQGTLPVGTILPATPKPEAVTDTAIEPAEPVELSRRERRRITRTPEFKAAWKEKKQEIRLDGREPKKLTQPHTWLNPDRWFEGEKTVAAKIETVTKMAVKFAFDADARKEMLGTEVSRRQMLGGILGTAGTAALIGTALTIRRQTETVMKAVEQNWPENKPTFNFLEGEVYNDQEQVGIFFPGFGDMHSKEEAQQWRANGKLDPNMPVAYMDYSNKGATPKELAELIRSNIDVDKVKSVALFGRSMGGPMELAVAAELGIPVKSMILCSSPFEISDGSYGNIGQMVAGAPNDKQLATEAKFDVNVWKAFKQHWLDLPEVITEGWEQTVTGAAPWALQLEVKFLSGFDFNDPVLIQKLKNVLFADWTEVVYVESDQPETDKTVNDVAASMKYSAGLAKHFGIKLKIMGAPYDGHADVGVSSTKLQPWIEASSQSPKLPDKKAQAEGPLPGSVGH